MLSTEVLDSQIYKQVLRNVLRSQILHMVDQLSETGEESFIISASGEDNEPHILGAKLGLAYMQGFRGVLDGFPNFIQRKLCTSEKNHIQENIGIKEIAKTTVDPLQSQPELIKSALTKLFSSSTLQSQHDEVNEDTADNANNYSEQLLTALTLKEKQLPTTSSELESEIVKTRQSFDQEQTNHSVTNEIPMEISEVSSQTSNLEIDSEKNNTKLIPDRERFDRGELGPEKTSDNNVTSDETIAISEKANEATGTADRWDEPDKIDDNGVDILMDNSANRLDEPDKVDDHGVDIPMYLQADALNSDDEESDFDCNESDYDELKEDEIFSRLIDDFENNKEDLNSEITKDVDNYKENILENDGKSFQAEKDSQESQGGNKERTKENSSKMNAKSKTTVCDIDEITDDVESVVLNHAKAGHGYRYKKKIYYLKDLLSPDNLLCKYCKKKSRTMKEVMEHEGKHSKTYTCYKCDKNFSSQAKLRAHHPQCYSVPALVKDFFRQNPDFTLKQRLVSHKMLPSSSRPDTKQSFRCGRCFRKFQYNFALKKHVCKQIFKGKIHSEQSNRSSIAVKATAKPHLSLHAKKSKLVDIASHNFKQNIKKNTKSDVRIRRFKCMYCEKRYFQSSHLKEHIVIHTGEKNFKCSICCQKLLRRSQFSYHKKQCELKNPGSSCYMIRLNGRKRKRKSCDGVN